MITGIKIFIFIISMTLVISAIIYTSEFMGKLLSKTHNFEIGVIIAAFISCIMMGFIYEIMGGF